METQEITPQAQILQLLEQAWLARAVSAAAQLNIADALQDGPQAIEELALATGTHRHALGRLMRAMCAYGIFDSTADGRFQLNAISQALVSRTRGSLRSIAAMLLAGEHWTAWNELEHSLRTGETAFDHHYGQDVWAFFRQNPSRGAAFNQTMVDSTTLSNQAILDACDFRAFEHLVDVGGGHGSLLRLALEQNHAARGTLFDQPTVIEEARPLIAASGLAGRCAVAAGDFFHAVPADGDAYLLKYILHDWDDARCLIILQNIRRAIRPRGTLMIFDTVVGQSTSNDMSTLMDLNMLVMTGGRERTEPELRDLLARSGFAFKRVVPTQGLVSVVEALAV